MHQIRSGGSAAAAVLAGSLVAFPLLDVLRLLQRTDHTGQLQVMGDGVEAQLWVDDGDLLERRAAAADRLFGLACLDDAWFTVTATLPPAAASDRTAGIERVPLGPLIERVEPLVEEWRSLVHALPFDAIARMAPSTPGPEVQIRADQWHVLSLIGAGRRVHELVDVSDAPPVGTLRIVRELAQAELVSVTLPGDPRSVAATGALRDAGGDSGEHVAVAAPDGGARRPTSTTKAGAAKPSGGTAGSAPAAPAATAAPAAPAATPDPSTATAAATATAATPDPSTASAAATTAADADGTPTREPSGRGAGTEPAVVGSSARATSRSGAVPGGVSADGRVGVGAGGRTAGAARHRPVRTVAPAPGDDGDLTSAGSGVAAEGPPAEWEPQLMARSASPRPLTSRTTATSTVVPADRRRRTPSGTAEPGTLRLPAIRARHVPAVFMPPPLTPERWAEVRHDDRGARRTDPDSSLTATVIGPSAAGPGVATAIATAVETSDPTPGPARAAPMPAVEQQTPARVAASAARHEGA